MTFPPMKMPFVLLMVLVCVISCSKSDNVKPQKGFLLGIDSTFTFNYVLISSNQIINDVDSSDIKIGVGAAFMDSITGQLNSVQLLKVNNRVLFPNSDNTYSYYYGEPRAPSPEGLALPGTYINIKVDGVSSADTVTQTIYMPRNVMRYTSDFPNGTIDISHTQSIAWVPDPNNERGNVVIHVSYESGLSRLYDSTMPASINTVTYTVPDNGSYTLPHSGLQVFPNKSYIEISISRASQNIAVLPVSRKRVYCLGISSANTPPLYVENQ